MSVVKSSTTEEEIAGPEKPKRRTWKELLAELRSILKKKPKLRIVKS